MGPQHSTSSHSGLFDRLTDSQREAVTHISGPLLIIAGPGSGKTRVITHRIAHMIEQGVAPWQIVALTFTNKAADEIKLRIEQLVSRKGIWAGTFHGFCARMLRQHASMVGLEENFTIYDSDDSRRLLKQVFSESPRDLGKFTVGDMANAISSAKNKLIRPEDYTTGAGYEKSRLVADIYPAYQKRLLESNAVDFDDLLTHIAFLLHENPELRASYDERFQYVMVDEYQDTNFAQYEIVRALSIDHPNLAATGDPDQSIYGWRGANLGNILDFEKDFPDVKTVRLERNYRSTKRILNVADELISYNVRRKKKSLYTENPDGNRVRSVAFPTPRDEADSIVQRIAFEISEGGRSAKDFAIFYRTNALSRVLEHSFFAQRIPFQIVRGHEFYQRREIKDILAYLHLLNNPRDDIAFERIINVPSRRIGKVSIERLREHARRYHISMLEAARECGMIESIARRTATQIAKFVSMFDRLSLCLDQGVEAIISQIFKETDYRNYIAADGTEEADERVENLDELLSAAREFEQDLGEDSSLDAFLEQTALVSDIDEWKDQSDRVTLMTLHAAKGLEFPFVFIVGLEDGLLPHRRSIDDPDQVEEERRLLFVGITRAEEELQLSRALSRPGKGGFWPTVPSQFLMQLPMADMEVIEPKGGSNNSNDFSADDPWPDEAFVQDENPLPAFGAPVATPKSGMPLIQTAAAMAGETKEAPAVAPERFQLGMLVAHQKYGPGKIIQVSGEGKKRTASVHFFGGRERTFVLQSSELQLIKNGD